MIESVSQTGSKITACCHFMQPLINRFIPSMLAATANRKIASVKVIFCRNELCNSDSFFIPSAFKSFYYFQCPLREG